MTADGKDEDGDLYVTPLRAAAAAEVLHLGLPTMRRTVGLPGLPEAIGATSEYGKS